MCAKKTQGKTEDPITLILSNPLIIRSWKRSPEKGIAYLLDLKIKLCFSEENEETYLALGFLALFLNLETEATVYFQRSLAF